MATQANERRRRVAATANRLRLVQVDLADESPEVRMGYLAEEIQRALADLVPDERSRFLRDLMAEFPTWDAALGAIPGEEQVAAWSETDRREHDDPSFLVNRLAELAEKLNDAQRQALADHLREVGLAQRASGAWPEESVRRVCQLLNLDSKARLDVDRLAGLVPALVDFLKRLEPVVRQTWNVLAPDSGFLDRTPVQKALTAFCAGHGGVSANQIEAELEKLRGLAGAMAYALGRVSEFATGLLTRFAPSKIKDIVKLEPRGLANVFVAEEVRFWRRYQELASRLLTETAVEGEFKTRIRGFIQQTVQRKPARKKRSRAETQRE